MYFKFDYNLSLLVTTMGINMIVVVWIWIHLSSADNNVLRRTRRACDRCEDEQQWSTVMLGNIKACKQWKPSLNYRTFGDARKFQTAA